ncbi:MAG: sigma-54-dependent Fis family transcriptional regulator [Candidatus Eisenbacteria bacterium]|nr:sigma-54-dependent Fis family transcriptional regulator [Candidatus Eisenbacteria bacterium]
MPSRASLLVVDDDPVTLDLMREVLAGEGYEVSTARAGREALELCASRPFELVLTDVQMPGMSGLELLRAVRATAPETVFIVMTAFGNIDTAMEVVREGGYDYLSKPFKMEAVRLAVRRALEQQRLRRENTILRSELADKFRLDQLIGRSQPMQELYLTIARAAASRSTVLLQGESGTGKEMAARAIHFNGPRAGAKFVTVNCGAIPEPLMESELFGHVRGAFTGAVAGRSGLFEEADGGTLFLDEVGELSLGVQAKLLRVLQEHEVKRVGGNETIRVDVRVIAATNRDLARETREGRFREDLFYRLSVVTLTMPPLRDRREDIPQLCQHFLEKCRRSGSGQAVEGISRVTMERLVDHAWPGNVRELEDVIERAVARTGNRYLSLDDLPRHIASLGEAPPSEATPVESLTLREVQRRHIQRVLAAHGGNKTQAAQALGISRRTLIRVAQRFGLEGSLVDE